RQLRSLGRDAAAPLCVTVPRIPRKDTPSGMRIIGLDPGLQHTGWGIIDQDGSRLSFVAAGRISSVASQPLAQRLVDIHTGLIAVLDAHQPDTAAVEETFVNKNPTSTLKLGLARGVALLTPALHKLK